jgi:hypothetical protein
MYTFGEPPVAVQISGIDEKIASVRIKHFSYIHPLLSTYFEMTKDNVHHNLKKESIW